MVGVVREELNHRRPLWEKLKSTIMSEYSFPARKRTNSLLKKDSTSSVVDGPPMFMKTMAVGPFDDVSSCVTGGTAVARPARWLRKLLVTGRDPERALLSARGRERKAMVESVYAT